MPQCSILGPLLFLLYTSELFSILENKLIGYADDSTLIAVVPFPGVRVTVAESLNRDLVKLQSSFSTAWYLEVLALVFHDRLLLGRCFRGFFLPVLEYCSAMWCSAADTHLKTTGPCSQWCQFFNWGCVWVWPCTSSFCDSIMYAVLDQV